MSYQRHSKRPRRSKKEDSEYLWDQPPPLIPVVTNKLRISGSSVPSTMGDNSLGKLIKELQKLAVHSAPTPEKLTRDTDFARWEAWCKDFLQGFDAKAQSGAILALLDEKVYDLARSADIWAAASTSVFLDGLCEILGSSEHPWVLQSDFHRRYQQPGESINEFQQAFRLLGRRAIPTLDAKALNTQGLRQLVARVRDPQIRKALLRDRPSTLKKSLALAREEEVLQATCEQPPRSLFSVLAVQPHSSHDASTQMPWYSCSCGSSPRRNNWRQPQTRRPSKPRARRTVEAIDAAPGPSDDFGRRLLHTVSVKDDTQRVEHYLEVPLEGGCAMPEVFNHEQQVEKLEEVPPEVGAATELVDAAEDSRVLL
ncbi:unnamed protein product [Schistocephalus solidus]|uniref:Retrotransposon gag domain-containing protein n=1 Tax=Schistocephalus solidus TaxID=70667 RepID=A0A183TBI5_SCHSO|nr:unnamed protein product [Schistocephalus solidus]